MEICQVCQEKLVRSVPVADIDAANAAGVLLVCSGCADAYQQDHFEDLFASPIDFQSLNRDRRAMRQVA